MATGAGHVMAALQLFVEVGEFLLISIYPMKIVSNFNCEPGFAKCHASDASPLSQSEEDY